MLPSVLSLPAPTGNLKQHAVIPDLIRNLKQHVILWLVLFTVILGLVPGISIITLVIAGFSHAVRLMSHFWDHQAQKRPILRLMSHLLDHQLQVVVHFLDRYLQKWGIFDGTLQFFGPVPAR